MTTQELKNNIEKVLGNSIRCLLPSYWWKKLFYSVADRIDEVEVDVNNTLTKSFKEFEGKHPDIADRTFCIIYYGEEQAKQQEKNRVLYRKVYTELIAKSQIQPCYIAAPVIGVYDMYLACVNSQILLESGSIVVPNIYIMGGKKWMDVVIHEDGSTELRDTLYGSATSITVDSQLSDTSTNPVQNKVVYSEFQKKQNMISDLADIRSGAALGKTALQQADIADLATKDDITNLTNEIITNEKIHAAALNDLNERLNNGGESSGGSGVVTFYIPSGETVTDEEIAKNKAAYEAYVASYTNPPIVRLSYLDIPMHLYAAMSSYDIESNKVVVGIIHQADVIRQTVYMIGADGSVMLQQ